MHDILLVDDERAVLESLQSALDWSEYGFGQVLTAQSAQEAMQLMEQHEISLLILDILMPGMNGLEMLRLIRAQYPNMHCILISAHSKFEYAREALRLNVENYLLKPVDLNELRETVQRAAENIEKESADLHNLFERNMLERWLYGRITNDELVEHSRFTGYNVLMRRYYAISVYLKGNVKAALHKIAAKLQPLLPAYDLPVDDNSGIVLTGGRDITPQMIAECVDSVRCEHPDIRIACGSCALGSGEVSKSLADANHAMEYMRLAGVSGFRAYDEIDWDYLNLDARMKLSDLLRESLPEQKIAHWALERAECSEGDGMRKLYALICLTLTHSIEDEDLPSTVLPPLQPPYTPAVFCAAVEHAVTTLYKDKRERMQALSPIIQRAVKYINENLKSTLSIKQFCEQSKSNAAYIGRLFKEETGMYFSDYVCMLRINKAKILLETTTTSVSDIARQVGMYDVSYFTQRFKKQVRMSPMKYRQSIQQQKQSDK